MPAAAGLYVHWPFCKAKCPYCDFNSHVNGFVDHARWRRALLAELEAALARLEGHGLVSIFFGGGTPSLMEPETVAALVGRAREFVPTAVDLEVTLEANPTSVEAAKLRAFADAGVNRVSLGVQALDDAALRFLGREHDAAQALEALAIARDTFDRVSFDLIYARPDQTLEAWAEELDRALGFAAGHVALYQLTIEPGTKFHALWRAGRLRTLDDDREAALFEATVERLAAAGLDHYEVSNFARPGEGCRHNLVYWRYQAYAGVGPGAHGRLPAGPDGWGRAATIARRAPGDWLRAVEAHGHGYLPEEPLSPKDAASEALMMGLRLSEGVPLERLERLSGEPWVAILDRRGLERARAAGMVETDDASLRATEAGRLRLDALLPVLLA